MLSRTSNGKLFSINEEEQREALKGFYERWEFSRAPDSSAMGPDCPGPELGGSLRNKRLGSNYANC